MGEQQSGWGGRPVYVVDGSRTPYVKARGKPGPFSASDLAIAAGQPLLARQPFAAAELDEVILGCRDAASGYRHGQCNATVPPACSPSIQLRRTSPADVPAWCWLAVWSP
jgi:hypothetical protein